MMKNNNLLKYILLGVGNMVLLILLLGLIRPLRHPGETFATVLQRPSTWLISLGCGIASVYGFWRRDLNKGDRK